MRNRTLTIIQLNLFYVTALGLIVPSIVVSYFAFVHGPARYDRLPDEPVTIIAEPRSQKRDSLKEIVSRKDVWTLALFLLFYIGCASVSVSMSSALWLLLLRSLPILEQKSRCERALLPDIMTMADVCIRRGRTCDAVWMHAV